MATAQTGTNLRGAIADAELRELYSKQELTVARVAERFGVAPTTILRRLRDLGIPPRGPGTASGGTT